MRIQVREIKTMNDVAPDVQEAIRKMGITDASETMILARQLEIVKAGVLEKKYPELMGRSLVPKSPDGDNASEFLTVRYWDEYTMAKVIVNYATDFPLVAATMREETTKYFSVGNAFEYSIQDLRNASKAGFSLPGRKMEVARRGIEQIIDDVIFKGVPMNGIYGLMNNPNVPLVVLPNGNWASASGEQILADLGFIAQTPVNNTATSFQPNVIVLDAPSYGLIASKIVGTNLDRTVLSVFLANNPYIKAIRTSTKLNNLGSDGGPRGICYYLDPEVLQFEMGQEFETFPPETHAMVMKTACHARIGGVNFYHPLAACYFENHA